MEKIVDKVASAIQPFLVSRGFTPKSKNRFDFNDPATSQRYTLTLNSRKGRDDYQHTTYISVTGSLYFKNLIKKEKCIVDDALTGYPVLGGSIGKFKKSDAGHVSIPVTHEEQIEEVAVIIVKILQDGVLNLLKDYSTVAAIWEAIETQNPWFADYHTFLDQRNALRVASLISIVKDKESAISWYANYAKNQDRTTTNTFLKRMKDHW